MRPSICFSGVASVALLALGCGSSSSKSSGADSGVGMSAYDCLLQSDWQQVAPNPGPCNCTPSTWHFTKAADGKVTATENGCGHASGPVTTDGSIVTISYTYNGGAGVYKFPINDCNGGEGSVKVTAGPACVDMTFVIDWSPVNSN